MKALAISAMLALSLSACAGTTEEQRAAYRETGVILALVAIDVIRDVGLGPDEIDPEILKYVDGACRLLQAGGPLIVLAINTRVSEFNADATADDQIELVSPDEYLATLDASCAVISAILAPAPEVAPVPVPAPEA